MRLLPLTLLLTVPLAACTGAPSGTSARPPAPTPEVSVRVLGTAQDGGIPHAGCSGPRCERARRDPAAARAVASLLVETRAPARRYVIDVGPDFPRQLAALPVRDARGGVDRRPIDGILLTHAHVGHYLGLAHLGFEVLHSPGIPVHCTPAMAAFLRENAPWDQLVRLGNIELVELDGPRTLEGGVRIRALPVPHRNEYADTVAYVVEGPNRRLLYAPDTDGWDGWSPSIEEVLAEVDVALLDGTFWSLDELPGRAVESVGHPLVSRSIVRFAALGDRRPEIHFTHFNHSNPLVEDGDALARLRASGAHRLEDGARIDL